MCSDSRRSKQRAAWKKAAEGVLEVEGRYLEVETHWPINGTLARLLLWVHEDSKLCARLKLCRYSKCQRLSVANRALPISIAGRSHRGLSGDARAGLKARVFLRDWFSGKIRREPLPDGGLVAHADQYAAALLRGANHVVTGACY